MCVKGGGGKGQRELKWRSGGGNGRAPGPMAKVRDRLMSTITLSAVGTWRDGAEYVIVAAFTTWLTRYQNGQQYLTPGSILPSFLYHRWYSTK